jgi:hypothetical protein
MAVRLLGPSPLFTHPDASLCSTTRCCGRVLAGETPPRPGHDVVTPIPCKILDASFREPSRSQQLACRIGGRKTFHHGTTRSFLAL